MFSKIMNLRLAVIAFILGSSFLTGCATKPPTQTISIETRERDRVLEGAGCEIQTSKGRYFVTTPGTVSVQKADPELTVKCQKGKSHPGTVNVTSEVRSNTYGNILFRKIRGKTAYDYPASIVVEMGKILSIPPLPSDGLTKEAAAEADVRTGVSSASVEKLAKDIGCKTPYGAALLGEPGPIEEYEVKCDLGGSVKARCELRQCKLQ